MQVGALGRATCFPLRLFNRAADNWRPLLAVAWIRPVAIGQRWPARASVAEAATDDQSIGVMLLSDICDISSHCTLSTMSSNETCGAILPSMPAQPASAMPAKNVANRAHSSARAKTRQHLPNIDRPYVRDGQKRTTAARHPVTLTHFANRG